MRRAVFTLFACIALPAAYGQSVISVHSGVVHYVEGSAYIADKPVDMKFGHFPDIKPNEVFRTEEGRAEVLLAPGSFLRLAENSAVRMVSNQLTDTRFELLEGQILVESVDFTKDSAAAKTKGNVITVLYKESNTLIDKPGLYEFTSTPARLRVYQGEALVKAGSSQATIKGGRQTGLDGVLMAESFDRKVGDELTRWSERRSSYLAMANVSAARSMYSNSSMWSSYMGGYTGGWAFNPMFGMYTFVPMGGIGFSPFGYGYFSPYTVGLYYPYPYYGYGYYPGGGYYGGGSGGSSSSGNSSNPVVGGRHQGLGNFGGNSPVRAGSHAGSVPGFSGGGGGSRGGDVGFSRSSGYSNSSGGFPASISSGGGTSSIGSASSGGGMSAGGGRGGASGGGGGRGK